MLADRSSGNHNGPTVLLEPQETSQPFFHFEREQEGCVVQGAPGPGTSLQVGLDFFQKNLTIFLTLAPKQA
jgi:hypothetical protein